MSYTGTGGGKTANALGLALRSVGHEHKVVIIQFLNGGRTLENIRYARSFNHIMKFICSAEKVGLDNLGEEDHRLTKDRLKFAKDLVEEKKPHLLVLDEINLALHCNMLEIKEVLEFLDSIPEETDVVLTGRYAPKELLDRADFVNEMKDLKQPEEMVTTEGIQY